MSHFFEAVQCKPYLNRRKSQANRVENMPHSRFLTIFYHLILSSIHGQGQEKAYLRRKNRPDTWAFSESL